MRRTLIYALLVIVAGVASADVKDWFNPNMAPGGWSTSNRIFRITDEGPETITNEDGVTHTLRVGVLERKIGASGWSGEVHAKLYCGGKTVNKCVDAVKGQYIKVKSWQVLPADGAYERILARKVKILN